jgi:hypothetical protein
MKFLLILSFVILNSIHAQSPEIVWGAVQKQSKNRLLNYSIANGDFYYQLFSDESEIELKKINKTTMLTLDSTTIELDRENTKHAMINFFAFGDGIWLYTRSQDYSKKIASTWLHSIEPTTLAFSPPIKVADHYYPVNDESESYTYSTDDYSNYIFSQNLMTLNLSFLNAYCMTLSCENMTPVYGVPNIESQKERILISTIYEDNFDKKLDAKFKMPSPHFFIEQIEIDLDGSIYFLGYTSKVISNSKYLGRKMEEGEDLQIVKFNPFSGEYKVELVGDEYPYLQDYEISVDGDITLTGRNFNGVLGSDKIETIVYSNDLIKKKSFGHEIENDLADSLNTAEEIQYYKWRYKNAIGEYPPSAPLLNFEIIYSEILNNGDHVFALEKRSYANVGSMGQYPGGEYGPIRIISISKNGTLNWTQTIKKHQLSIKKHVGVFIHNDGENLYVWYNESDFLEKYANHNYIETTGKIIYKTKRIRFLKINSDGEIIENSATPCDPKNPLYLEPENCCEIEPGVVIMHLSNMKREVSGLVKLGG